MLLSLHQTRVTFLPLLLLFWRSSDGMPDPAQRELLIHQEESRLTGGQVTLREEAEKKLDAHLHHLKEKEISAPQFLPSMHFFKAKPFIQKSPVFKLLQKMPKGDDE